MTDYDNNNIDFEDFPFESHLSQLWQQQESATETGIVLKNETYPLKYLSIN